MRIAAMVVCILLVCGCAQGAGRASTAATALEAPRVARAASETGALDGAPFRIEVPQPWTGRLVLILHGYEMQARDPAAPMSKGALYALLLARGYAVAASGYRRGGWAVAEALVDNERLRQEFVRRHGAPTRTYAIGFSMGGHLVAATLERFGEHYAGGVSYCGATSPAYEIFADHMFEQLVAFDLLFPGVLAANPGSLGRLDAAALPEAAAIERALAADETRAVLLAQRFDTPRPALAQNFAFWSFILAELQQRAGGHPVDNRGRVYSGFGDDLAFNRGVARYAAQPAAQEYLRAHANLTGRIDDPLLLLHQVDDTVVAPLHSNRYVALAEAAGSRGRVVQQFVPGAVHCAFTPQQIGAALERLVDWAEGGSAPRPGEVE